jgi:hypothetical protein
LPAFPDLGVAQKMGRYCGEEVQVTPLAEDPHSPWKLPAKVL